jgi:phosphoglucomutase
VLQFITEDGSRITVRPSGTEPKIKFYCSVNTELGSRDDFDDVSRQLETKMDNIINDLTSEE